MCAAIDGVTVGGFAFSLKESSGSARIWALDVLHRDLGNVTGLARVEFARRRPALPAEQLVPIPLAVHGQYAFKGVRAAVEERFGIADKKLCWDMLASDHVPFNLFVPMRDQPWSVELICGWVGDHVARVTGIHIEWAPAPATSFLDDNTSFDAYITYDTSSGERGAIGIETKFTEGPYSWGATEKLRMFDEGSAYVRLTRSSKLYGAHALDALRTPKLKQLWRNQLLGEAMKQRSLVDEFISVIVFPSGNTHYASASTAHHELMAPEARGRFVPVTFEALFTRLRTLCETAEAKAWLGYLERRYVVP